MLVGAPLAEWRRAYRSSPLRHGRQRPAKRPPLAVRIRVLDRFARASSGPTSALRLPGLIALRRRHGRPASAADRWRQASRPSRTGPSAAPAPPFTTKRPHGAAPGFHSLASATDRPSALASRLGLCLRRPVIALRRLSMRLQQHSIFTCPRKPQQLLPSKVKTIQ